MVFACDRYRLVKDNIQAIRLSIEALRGLERWGASDMLERAFTGFQALPDHSNAAGWRDVLGCHGVSDIDQVERHWKKLRSKHHPDHCGDNDMFLQVKAAWEQAQKELSH